MPTDTNIGLPHMSVKRMECMRQQAYGCLKGAFVGRDLSPLNLQEPTRRSPTEALGQPHDIFSGLPVLWQYSSGGCVFLFLVLGRSIEKLAFMPYDSRVKQ